MLRILKAFEFIGDNDDDDGDTEVAQRHLGHGTLFGSDFVAALQTPG